MNKDFQDYLDKKSDMLQATCSCGDTSYVFIDTIESKYYTVCRKCHKKIFQVTCTKEKCKTGYSFPEDDKAIDLVNQSWKCDFCKTVNNGLPQEEIKNYYKSELPAEVLKEEDSRGLPKWAKTMIWIVMIVLGVVYLFSKINN